MIRSKGDELVNHAIDSRLERESSWSKKYSTVSQMHKLWQENLDENKVQNPSTNTHATQAMVKQAKKAMLTSVQNDSLDFWNARIKKLTFQGDFAQLLIEERTNVTWKSYANNIPKGILSFAIKSSVNGLNTPDNLKRWRIRKTDKCDICKNRSNLEHILNWCPVALKQKRFTWRHDSVLSHLTQELVKSNKNILLIYTAIPGHKSNGGTLPPDVLVTDLRPDIVMLDRTSKVINIFELTCSFEKSIPVAHLKITTKFFDLTTDLTNAILTNTIKDMMKLVNSQAKPKKIISELSRISLLTSFSIFQARSQPSWESPPLLYP